MHKGTVRGRISEVPDLVPVHDAATEFQVGSATLWRYLADGRLTRYRRGLDRKTYLDRRQLRSLLRPRAVRAD